MFKAVVWKRLQCCQGKGSTWQGRVRGVTRNTGKSRLLNYKLEPGIGFYAMEQREQ